MTDDVTNPEQQGVEPDADQAADADQAEGGAEGQPVEAKPPLSERMKEKVDVVAEDVGSLRKKLTVTVPRDLVDQQKDEQYGELSRDAVVPGFRRGRAPRRLLEKRFGSDVNETLVQQLVTNGYMAAIDKLGIKPIGDPLIWVREKDKETDTLVDVQKAIDTITLPDQGSLTFACELEIRPEFELPATEGIPVEKPVLTITEEDLTKQLDRFRALRGHHEPVPEEAVQTDDAVYVDLKLSAEGHVLHEHENVRLAARPQVIEGISVANLGEVLAGARIGDIRTATGKMPEDYEKAELRGKEATLEFKIREVHRLKLPEIDEQFFKSLGFENEEEMRKFIRAEMESRLGQEVQRGMRGQVQKWLLDHTAFDLPEGLSNRQIDSIVVRRMLDLYNQGVPPAEVEKHMDELKTSAREAAVHDLKMGFIMEKLSEKIEVEVNEGEMNGMIAEIARRQNRRFDRVRDELIKQDRATSVYVAIRDEKILNRLLETAKVTEKTPDLSAGGGAPTASDAT